MKRILLSFMLALLAITPAFANVGITVGGAAVGTAGNLNLGCDPNSTITSDGFTYNAQCNANFINAGIANSGTTSMTTTGLVVPVTYSFVKKNVASLASGSFSAGTLANGVPGQVMTILITGVGSSGTFVVTPATSTGWSSITFNTYSLTAPQTATFLYVNNTIGWVILSYTGSTLPTVTDANGV